MSSSVKSFSIGYNPINQSNVFTSGDYITGQVTLEVTSDIDVNTLGVKLKGKAEVRWTETHGKTTVTYHSKEKYFSIKQFLIKEGQGNNHVSQGSTVYPFSFQIPVQDLPSSFKGAYGKITYTLEANLGRSMRMDNKAKAKFTVVCKGNNDASLMTPQHGVTDKKMKLFNSGYVAMDVNIDRSGYIQGEGIKVVTSIHNKSSREVRPKYCLYRKHSFFASGRRKLDTKDLLKEVGDAVPPSAGQTVTRIITIPATTLTSIHNCNILKVEYRLRVYLDVKYAVDPELKFPIVILPAGQGLNKEEAPVYPVYGFEAPPTYPPTNYPPPYPGTVGPSAPPPPSYDNYGAYGIYPSLPQYGGKS